MRRTILCLITALLLSGCGIDYEGSTKYIFKGRITDRSGQPMPGIEVSTFVSNGNDEDIISYDHTDSNGNYVMIFPKARKVKTSLYINSTFNGNSGDTTYSGMVVFGIKQEEIDNYTIDFGTTMLYRISESVNLRINLVSTSNRSIVKLRPVGLVQYSQLEYDPASFPDISQEDQYYDPYNRLNYLVAKNQDLVLKYLLEDNTVHEVRVPIGTEDVTFNLEY
jgi:hypothetical protein